MRFDNNRYSVSAHAVGRPVDVRAYAKQIELRQAGLPVGDHPDCFGRHQTVFDPWHYVPVLARKPGALRNGAPFKDWLLPAKCPELNPVENVWQFMRNNWLSNRVFQSYDAIVDHCCHAWNQLADQPLRVMSIGRREWAQVN